MMMIVCGLASLAIGTVQHVTSMRQLRANYPEIPLSLAAALGGLIAILGIVALVAVLFRQ
jgi:hypothetical protein